MKNKKRTELTAQEQSTIHNALEQVLDILKPHFDTLSSEEKRAIPKMGEGTVSFMEKIVLYSMSDPDFMPPYVDTEKLNTDMAVVKIMSAILKTVKKLHTGLSDTIMLSGSEAYSAGLIYYDTTSMASHKGVLGAADIYNDLKKRFSKLSHSDDAKDTDIGIDEEGVNE